MLRKLNYGYIFFQGPTGTPGPNGDAGGSGLKVSLATCTLQGLLFSSSLFPQIRAFHL